MSVSTNYICDNCKASIRGYYSSLRELSPISNKVENIPVINENYNNDYCPYCLEGIFLEEGEAGKTWLHEKEPKKEDEPTVRFPRYTATLERLLSEALKQADTLVEADKSILVSVKSRPFYFNDLDTTIDTLGEQVIVKAEALFLSENGGLRHIRNIKHYTEYLNHPPYNILSYLPEGEMKYIKVITTMEASNEYPIVLNPEEIEFMEQNPKNYFVYRLLSFNKKRKTTRIEMYRGADDISNRRLISEKDEAIIQAFITHDSDFSAINEKEEEDVVTHDDYKEFVGRGIFLWSIQGLSERELIIFTKSLFLYERYVGIFNENNPILKILELPVIKKSDEYKALLDWLLSRNREPYDNYLKPQEKKKMSFPRYEALLKQKSKGITLPNDNDTTRKEQARDLVKHLEMVGQIPKTDPIELEKYLTEEFPLAKDQSP